MPTFDALAEKYDLWFETPLGKYVADREKRLILELAKPVKGEKMLDVGIGTGFFALEFLKRGADITGIDVSLKMLAIAEKKGFTNISTGDAVDIHFPDEMFDLVVSVTALEFIEEPRRAVSEMMRVCKKGGRVVVGTLGADSLWAHKRRRDMKKNPESVFHHAHFYTFPELQEITGHFNSRAALRGAVFVPPYDNALCVLAGQIIERPCQRLFPFWGAFLAFRIDKE
ncbi:MAG: class I SAM-dependent methyltransferase [Syntrophales bacterium]